jgi:hypothetical protein
MSQNDLQGENVTARAVHILSSLENEKLNTEFSSDTCAVLESTYCSHETESPSKRLPEVKIPWTDLGDRIFFIVLWFFPVSQRRI